MSSEYFAFLNNFTDLTSDFIGIYNLQDLFKYSDYSTLYKVKTWFYMCGLFRIPLNLKGYDNHQRLRLLSG